MRKAKRLTAAQVAGILKLKLGRESYDTSGVLHMERRGVRDYDVIAALAEIYDQPISAVAEAGKSA